MANPEDKQMKMQWLTVDGRSVPVVLPQIWDYELEDWVVTSTANPIPTQVTGSIAVYTTNNTTEIPSNGNEVISVKGSSSFVESIFHLGVFIPAPSGATTGTHRLRSGFKGLGYANLLLDITASYNESIIIQNGIVASKVTKETPVEKDVQFLAINGVCINDTNSLEIRYDNLTDTSNTNSRNYNVSTRK